MSKHHVVLFITALTQGGAERQILILATQLVNLGYNVSLVTYVDLPDYYEYDQRINRVRLAEGKNKILKIISIIKYFRTVKTDVVISYAERNNFLAVSGLVGRRTIKLIVSERNYKINNYFLLRCLRRIFYLKADYIVPNSYAQGEFLTKLNLNIRRKIRVITNYTDINKFYPLDVEQKSRNNPIKFCIFARIDPQKNYVRLCYAVEKLISHSRKNFVIDWFGKNTDAKGQPSTYYNEFSKLIEELRLENVIRINPPSKEVNKILRTYDAFILPSIYEGFSNSLGEAIASGLPCIVSDVSDNKVMVKDGVNGFLFNPLNLESICESMNKYLCLSEDQVMSFREQSRKIATELFNIDHFVSKYTDLF